MNVSSMLRGKGSDIFSLSPTQTIEAAVALLSEHKIGAAVVTGGDGKLVGILSERDVVRGLGQSGSGIMSGTVADLMTANVETCSPDDTADELMRRMTDGRFRHMPVMEGDNVVGVISIGDVVKSRISELENETEAMRGYIAGHG